MVSASAPRELLCVTGAGETSTAGEEVAGRITAGTVLSATGWETRFVTASAGAAALVDAFLVAGAQMLGHILTPILATI